MNFDHLYKVIKSNYKNIKNIPKALKLLKYSYEILLWKKEKLKLGAITFDFKELIFGGVTIWRDIEMRYTRQDTTKEDELKLENRLKALAWQWDFKNVFSFLFVSLLIGIFIYSYFYCLYCEHFPAFAYRESKYDKVLYHGFETSLVSNTLVCFQSWVNVNYLLVNALTEICINFDLLL